MKKFNLALIGCGNQGASHLSSIIDLHKQGRICFSGICDKNEDHIFKFKKTIDFEITTSTSYIDFLNDNDIDIAVLSLPNDLYKEVLEICFRRGIHVLKEKPFGLNLNESISYIELSRKHNCLLRIAQQRKHHIFYKKASNWIKSIGTIRFIDYKFTLNDTKNSWYWVKEKGGGSWYGLGWHACFVIHYFLGLPEMIQAKFLTSQKRNFDYSTDDTVFLECKYNTGTIVKALLSVVSTDKKEEIYMSGSLGNIRLNRKEVTLFSNTGEILDHDNNYYPWELAYSEQLSVFISDCERLDKEKNNIELLNGCETMQMVEAGFMSAKNEGINVFLPNIMSQVNSRKNHLEQNLI
ncbi:Gfo/Idh/MocA family protein [Aquimarina celericrescens]|uniref:Gfo/Idh/MocA family protein n=1 Tax=Aquimarina celericrescens TaxID=1964542 RepID=A0ABW5AY06_9FLAO|nr:Gfo/Idh/MocA family oxidoreductase [Aquimarina celericrescens]